MESYVRLKLDSIRNKGWVVSSSFPKTSRKHKDFLQLVYNVVDESWVDRKHLHSGSEEWYIVPKGELDVEVSGRVVTVGPKEILGVKANVPHRVMGGRGPNEEFSLRTPSVEDKRLLE